MTMVSETALAISKDVIHVIVTVIVAYSLKKLVTDTIVNNFARSAKVTRHGVAALKKVFAIVIYFGTFVYVLSIFHLQAPLLAVLSGAGFAGIVVGFAAKDVIANFIGGIVLLIDRPFKIGDEIEVENIVGKVTDISVRTTVIQSFDGEYVTVPNATIMNSIVRNRSAPDKNYRVKVPISVDYKTDLKKLERVVRETLLRQEFVLQTPEPRLLFRSFGQSSIDFDAAFWIDISVRSTVNTRTDAAQKLKQAFDKAGIKMPYPHLEIVKGRLR